jgi:hypothetical protein
MRIVLIVGSVFILVGVSLLGWILTDDTEEGVIEVELKDGKTQTIEFENLSLVPGEECEYTIKLEKAGADKCDLNLNFVETEEKTLKNFAHVKIISGDEVICDELLAKVLEDDDIVLPVDFAEDKNTELKIVYYLPVDIGNEAKNAEAVFELLLTASNE